jgi:hypothetical protein
MRHGGPAFPLELGGDYPDDKRGMTLRDYFAAAAVPGLMTQYWNSDRLGDPTFASIAQEAYQLANAMLKERAK